MNQVNAIIRIDMLHLGRATATIEARCGSEFVAQLVGVPDDMEYVTLRVCPGPENGGFYDFPASRSASGEWFCRILGMAFAAPSVGWYEVRGGSAAGNPTALGRGTVRVFKFSARVGGEGQAGAPDSRRREVMTVTDEAGAMHAVYAVQDEAGAWTFVIGDVDA